MLKEFLGSGGGRGNHKKKDGSKTWNDSSSQPAKLDDSFVGLGNDTTKDNVNVVSSVDEPVFAFGNNNGTKEGNVGKCSTPISTTAPNTGSVPIHVHESPTIDNSAPIRSGPTSYAKLVIGEPSRKSVNFRTLITPVGNGVDVSIQLESIRAISERSKDGLDAMLENGLWFISNNPFILKKWNPDVNLQKEDVGNVSVWVKLHGVSMTTSSYARAMIELRADKELKDTIVVVMPNLVGDGFNMFIIRVEYEWKPPRHVSNKNGAITSGKKKQTEVSRQENEGNSSSAGKGVASSSISTTPITERIDKFERQLIEGKLLLVDDDGKPLPKFVSTVNADTNSEVEEVFDEHATFMASIGLKRGSDSGYGANSLWEQWKETKHDDDYDPYDDDLYSEYL
ncbi:putative reverse transcriptase domain-containing protein [Tanacetum coccineum]